MKVRILITVILLAFYGWFLRGIARPVGVIAKNTAVVATVNGGDEAYVAQEALRESFNYGPFVSFGMLTGALILVWRGQFKSKSA